MSTISDDIDLTLFKGRLRKARKGKNWSQLELANALGLEGRSGVANWEGGNKFPSFTNFIEICKLLDMQPNYLLGVNKGAYEDDYALSEAIGLLPKNVNRLRSEDGVSRFIDHLLSSAELEELLRRIKQISCYKMLYQAQETTFTREALKKIKKAFDAFYENTFPLDMNAEHFAEYVREEFTWFSDKGSIEDFIAAVITENEYNNILFDYPDFESKSDEKKYEILIWDIAKTSYDYMMGKPIIELAEQEIAKALAAVVDAYISNEVKRFRDRSPQ